jgi:ribulose-5-phosphate 4-epimerase/fuculose-1-phosphate aldolase
VRDLGPHQCMVLRNHGLLAAGRSIAEAFVNIYFLERACQAQIKAQAGGAALTQPSEAVCRRTAEQFQREGALAHCELAWQSALRLLRPEPTASAVHGTLTLTES